MQAFQCSISAKISFSLFDANENVCYLDKSTLFPSTSISYIRFLALHNSTRHTVLFGSTTNTIYRWQVLVRHTKCTMISIVHMPGRFLELLISNCMQWIWYAGAWSSWSWIRTPWHGAGTQEVPKLPQPQTSVHPEERVGLPRWCGATAELGNWGGPQVLH